MTRVIDAPEALELLERAMQAKGEDYVDPNAVMGEGCEYGDEFGHPSCIVGHVFSYLGVDVTTVSRGSVRAVVEQVGIIGHSGELIPDTPGFTYNALTVLDRAQSIQDGGGTWGDAVASASMRAKACA